jgi:hypothetical protein
LVEEVEGVEGVEGALIVSHGMIESNSQYVIAIF